jgi:transglutaminase-like putative cysteine protease
VIPTLSSSLLDDSNRLGSGDGNGELQFNDPMVSLASALRRDEEVDLIEVDSDVSPSYLRMTVLDEPGPDRWYTGEFDLGDTIPINNILPGPTGLGGGVERTPHAMTIRSLDAFPSDSPWFPVPFNSSSIGLSSDDWAYFTEDQTALAVTDAASARVEEVSVSYASLDYDEAELSTLEPIDPEIRRYADVPPDIPTALINEARVVTSGAATSYERAVLLQAFFRDGTNFDYDVKAGYGYGYQAMVDFLRERRGFCQHFAATMAMMARTLGIPSRVVTGLLRPSDSSDGTYVFTSHDLHAWPELYFPGSGWVRFEPTPGVGAPLPEWASEADPTIGPEQTTPTAQETTDPFATRSNGTASSDAAAGQEQGSGGGSAAAPSVWWLLPPAVIALLLVPALTRIGIRRRRLGQPIDEASAAEAAWLELRDRMADLRMQWRGSMTPRAREKALVPLLREDEPSLDALHRLAMSVERARYSTSPLADARPGSDAVIVMHQLDRTVSRRQRTRALLWPSSLMPDLTRAWAQLRSRVRRRATSAEA